MAFHNDFGKRGEDLAVEYLQNKGYSILSRNFRYKKFEIDIIAEVDNLVIIIEVKARSTDAFMLPQEAVTKSKIKQIVAATNYYLEKFNHQKEARFDIISVLQNSSGELQVEHLIDAFEAFDAN